MSFSEKLQEIRDYTGKKLTTGLTDEVLSDFGADENLRAAVDYAYSVFTDLKKEYSDILKKDEAEQIAILQDGFVNFYAANSVNPYIAIAAQGPWLVTSCGAVLHDSGGYGMLGLGHSPKKVLAAMNKKQVMANIMSPSFSQKRLVEKLNKELGFRRDSQPYGHYLCLNSGSESVTVALRISDTNAFRQTSKGARHEGKVVKLLALKGGFHGRTDRPSQASDSCLSTYNKNLASFRDRDNLLKVEPNNIEELKAVFAQAEKDNVFIECLLMEPVMGEGDPGKSITPEFYTEARKLTKENGSLLLVDSIQAGLRTQGCLSISDYPGFENLEAPDFETFSKALNAGQYPLSVLAMGDKTSELYKRGTYGNTMTANPRALDVACSVLDSINDEFRKNIQEKGVEFVDKLKKLQEEFPDVITKVQGTGLLFAAEINPKIFAVVGDDGLEKYLRTKGIGVIHGGANALRFTPHFLITTKEVDLMIDLLRSSFKSAPRL